MLYFKDPINCVNDLCHLSWLIQDNRRLLKALNSIASCSNGTLFTQLDRNGFTNCPLHSSLNEDEDQPIVYCPSAEKELISPCSCQLRNGFRQQIFVARLLVSRFRRFSGRSSVESLCLITFCRKSTASFKLERKSFNQNTETSSSLSQFEPFESRQ